MTLNYEQRLGGLLEHLRLFEIYQDHGLSNVRISTGLSLVRSSVLLEYSIRAF